MTTNVQLPSSTAQSGPMVPRRHRVVERIQELPDTVTLVLEPVDEPLAEPAPGQFNMLWAFGIGEAPISLASGTASSLVHTIRDVGAVTSQLCKAQVGEMLGVRGPYGTGWDVAAARGRDVLVVAGGLGTAPVRPIIEHVLANRQDFGRLAILIGSRSPEALLYLDKLEQWRSRLDVDVEITVDVAPATWRGDVGLVTKLIDRAPVDLAESAIYVCGPEIMMEFVAAGVIDRGAQPDRVFVSLERNMHCAIGHCGHCQLGPAFICKDGPVLAWDTAAPLLKVKDR